MSMLVLTAHGSADPRSAASAHEVAHTIRMVRRDVDVRVAFLSPYQSIASSYRWLRVVDVA